MRLSREIKEKVAKEHGSGSAQKNHLDGTLPVQIAGISLRIEALKGQKNGTAKHQLLKLKRIRGTLLSIYRRIDKEGALKLEEQLHITHNKQHHKH